MEAITVLTANALDFFPAMQNKRASITDADASYWRRTLRSFLSSGEINRLQQYACPQAAALYLLSHGLLRAALRELVPDFGSEEDFCLNPYGKPELPAKKHGPVLHFNLSHSWPLVALVFSPSAECGIDVETTSGGASWNSCLEYLHPLEQEAILAATDRMAAFVRCWTRKEAVAKTAGTGLSWDFSTFRVCPDAGTVFSEDVGLLPVGVKSLNFPHYVGCSLAVGYASPAFDIPPVNVQCVTPTRSFLTRGCF